MSDLLNPEALKTDYETKVSETTASIREMIENDRLPSFHHLDPAIKAAQDAWDAYQASLKRKVA